MTFVGTLKKNVFLVGFMGVGKTTVARRMARDMAWPASMWTPSLSENTASRAAELFGELGEDALRELEYEALVECANMGPSLISCGEGIVAYDKSRELLKRRGFAVMLESSEATSLGRIHNLSTRPLLAHDCDIEGLWEQRKPLYEEVARAKINVQGRSTGSVAGFVAKVLARAGVYTPDSEDAVAKKIEADSLKRHKKHRHSKSGRPRSAAERSNASHKGQKAARASRENAASSKKHVAHAPASGQGAAERKQNGSGAPKHRRRRGSRGRGKMRASNNRQNGQRGATPPAN